MSTSPSKRARLSNRRNELGVNIRKGANVSSMTATRLAGFPLAPETQKYLDSALIGHVIDGEVLPSRSGQTMPIINPATAAEIGQAASGDIEDLERAVASARRAFDD